MPQWLVIGISGVTCGGKTTLSHNLRNIFQSNQNGQLGQTPYTIGDVELISQDDYFLPVEDRRHKWIEKLNVINFELLTSLDMKRMLFDITWMMKGRYLVNGPLENIDYINDISMAMTFEHYAATNFMPPPVAPSILHYQNNKLQLHQQQQNYQTTNHYYHQHQHQPHNHHHQQQPPLPLSLSLPQPQHQPHNHHHQQQQQQHHHRPHQHQQRQQQQHHQHQQQQRNAARIGNVGNNHQTAIKLRDCKVNILIVEGFMIFNHPELLTLCNIKFHFHLPYEKCYERRLKRTYDPPDVTGYFEMCVWPHYEKNFSEFRDRKDITFLNGEISKERICDFALQNIMRYVEERCDVLMVTTSPTTTFTAPPPHKLIGIHNGNGNGNILKPCPMEQQ